VIKKLQAEVSDYKDRLKKVEEEVSSFKQKEEVAPKQVIGTMPAGTTEPLKKRGRPKQSLELADALNKSHLGAVGKKPAMCNSLSKNKSQFEKVRPPIFEKVILKKAENKRMTTRSTSSMAQQENKVNILNDVKDGSSNNREKSGRKRMVNSLIKDYVGVKKVVVI